MEWHKYFYAIVGWYPRHGGADRSLHPCLGLGWSICRALYMGKNDVGPLPLFSLGTWTLWIFHTQKVTLILSFVTGNIPQFFRVLFTWSISAYIWMVHSDLNWDGGHHQLPHIWDTILQSFNKDSLHSSDDGQKI